MLQSVIQQSLGTNPVIGESLASHIAGPTSPTPSIDSDSLSGGINVAGSVSSAVRTSILNGSGTGNISCDTNSDNVSNGSRSESSGLGSIGTSTIIGSGRPLSDGGNGELGRPNVGRSASSSSTASSSSSGLGSSPLGCRASSASSLFTSTTVAGSNGLSGGLVQLPGSSGGSPTGNVKCWHCCNNFDRPKVLHGCFHTFCEPCLEKIQDHPEKITCPQCNTETMLGNAGISGLLSDYGIFGMESSTLNGEQHVHSNICTSCKTRESTAVARCLTCSNFLCPNCVTAHQEYGVWKCTSSFINVYSLNGDAYLKQPPITRPTSITSLSSHTQSNSAGSTFASSISRNQKTSYSNLSDRMTNFSYDFTHENADLATSSLNDHKNISGAHNAYPNLNSMSYTGLNCSASQKYQISNNDHIQNNQASNANLLARSIKDININSLSNDQSSSHSILTYQQLDRLKRNSSFCSSGMSSLSSMNQPLNNTQQHISNLYALDSIASMCQTPSSQHEHKNGNSIEEKFYSKRFSESTSFGPVYENRSGYEKWSNGLNSVDHSSVASTSKMHLFGNGDNVAAAVAAYGASLNAGSNSGASNSIHPNAVNNDNGRGLSGNSVNGQNQLNSVTSSNNATAESIMELSTKMLQVQQQQFNSSQNSQTSLSTNGSSTSSMFPPKSQIKRQKMIYHCKFGEFGVLEGQFTEPSGVAVNAQNDIIVADTNNHRIQIFDKEGRFKFQFGECGKRDGQLLYPNRVAAVRASGDIIVTERSPTHQVQIYNQYGQFVRKFGANILQHPRGVCVDNKGRIIVVECKVMRVIIFDQMGNVLNKFGCSKHLEFPNGVVVNDRQEIFISDNRAHCVKVFNYEGTYLRQIGGEGLTNYPIGVGINGAGEVTIADNHNNFNLSVFSQEGQLLSALESKVKHAQCFDVALMDDGSVVLASKDYRLYIYRYVQLPPMGMLN